jgi:hypothetical protein
MDEVVRLIFFVSIYLRVWGQKKLNFENSPGDMNQQNLQKGAFSASTK